MLYNAETFEQTTSVTRFERAHRIEMSNPLNGVPSVAFVTSWVERDNSTGEEVQKELHRTVTDVVNPDETFPVFDAEGNFVTNMSYGDVAGTLYNLFFHVATKADS